MIRRRLPGALCVLALFAVIASAAATPAVAATQRPDAAALANRADAFASAATARWESLQHADGRFPDQLTGYGVDYGTPMLGLAIARRGLAVRDAARVEAGLKAIVLPTATPTDGSFELLALVRSYSFMRDLASDLQMRPLWERYEPRLREHLRTRTQVTGTGHAAGCIDDPGCYNNIKLVKALALQLLDEAGVAPRGAGSLLGALDDASYMELFDVTVPKVTGRQVTRAGRAPIKNAGLLSDPPSNPLAYHALSIATLGELIQRFGDRARPTTRHAYDRAVRGLLAMASPSGDLSYYGRGQGQVWTGAAVVQAAAQAASSTSSKTLRRRALALAEAALDRLERDYPLGPAGLPLAPGANTAGLLRTRKLDAYAAQRTYNGLAIDSLDNAVRTLRTIGSRDRSTTVPSRRDGVVISPRQAGLITLTRGQLWVALAARTGSWDDARYGSGLLSIERRSVGDRWQTTIPQPPFAAAPAPTLAVRDGSQLRVPHATRLHAGRNAALAIGRWSRPGRRGWDDGTAWIWRITRDGSIEVAFTAHRARTVVAGALAGEGDRVTRVRGGVRITRAVRAGATPVRVTYRLLIDGRAARSVKRTEVLAGASAYDAQLRHTRVESRARRGARVTLRIRVSRSATSRGPAR